MKEVSMDINWRTIQFFISEEGPFEVEMDYDNNRKLRCNCPDFQKVAKCKHQKFVKNLIEENGGYYSIQIPVEIDEDEALLAFSSSENFREFILKYGKVEVL
jgi:hypothetical protein